MGRQRLPTETDPIQRELITQLDVLHYTEIQTRAKRPALTMVKPAFQRGRVRHKENRPPCQLGKSVRCPRSKVPPFSCWSSSELRHSREHSSAMFSITPRNFSSPGRPFPTFCSPCSWQDRSCRSSS